MVGFPEPPLTWSSTCCFKVPHSQGMGTYFPDYCFLLCLLRLFTMICWAPFFPGWMLTANKGSLSAAPYDIFLSLSLSLSIYIYIYMYMYIYIYICICVYIYIYIYIYTHYYHNSLYTIIQHNMITFDATIASESINSHKSITCYSNQLFLFNQLYLFSNQ